MVRTASKQVLATGSRACVAGFPDPGNSAKLYHQRRNPILRTGDCTMAKRKSAPKSKAATSVPAAPAAPTPATDDVVDGVRLTMTIEVGRTRETIGRLTHYGEHTLVELDKTVDEPVDILLNGELFARGEVVTVSENFGVRVTELVNPRGG